MLKVFSGSANKNLAESIAGYLGIKLSDVSIGTFNDGMSNYKSSNNLQAKPESALPVMYVVWMYL